MLNLSEKAGGPLKPGLLEWGICDMQRNSGALVSTRVGERNAEAAVPEHRPLTGDPHLLFRI